jgi:Zn-finger nucleic acid-binding protein
LRRFQQRLVCDGCNGIMVSISDLAGAIEDLTSVVPQFAWDHEKPSERACPECRSKMTVCHIVLQIEAEVLHPKPELDRCEAHGVWFDSLELAKVLEKAAGKGHGAKSPVSPGSRTPDRDYGRWSAMFPYFGGRGGF